MLGYDMRNALNVEQYLSIQETGKFFLTSSWKQRVAEIYTDLASIKG